jgi:2',3'-cyclic-nucleotide 2'-phosphodiesterase (5'-nucleotidase family)
VNVIVLLTHVGIDIDVVLGAGLSVLLHVDILFCHMFWREKIMNSFHFVLIFLFLLSTLGQFCAMQGVDVIIGGDSHTLLTNIMFHRSYHSVIPLS